MNEVEPQHLPGKHAELPVKHERKTAVGSGFEAVKLTVLVSCSNGVRGVETLVTHMRVTERAPARETSSEGFWERHRGCIEVEMVVDVFRQANMLWYVGLVAQVFDVVVYDLTQVRADCAAELHFPGGQIGRILRTSSGGSMYIEAIRPTCKHLMMQSSVYGGCQQKCNIETWLCEQGCARARIPCRSRECCLQDNCDCTIARANDDGPSLCALTCDVTILYPPETHAVR